MSATIEELMEWRGIEKLCERCGGCGSRAYGNTSTWVGGIGGQMITSGVCDSCWGSGDAAHPWVNLRKMRAEYLASRDKSTLADLLNQTGGGESEHVRALAEVLRKIHTGAVRRGSLGFWSRNLAGYLGEALERIAGEKVGAK